MLTGSSGPVTLTFAPHCSPTRRDDSRQRAAGVLRRHSPTGVWSPGFTIDGSAISGASGHCRVGWCVPCIAVRWASVGWVQSPSTRVASTITAVRRVVVNADSRVGGRVVEHSGKRQLFGVYTRSRLSTRSNACYYGADLVALPGRRDGRNPRRRTEQHWMHGFHHLAKVRVAGSNPVVRSKQSPAQPGCAPRLFSCPTTFIARLSRGPDAPTDAPTGANPARASAMAWSRSSVAC